GRRQPEAAAGFLPGFTVLRGKHRAAAFRAATAALVFLLQLLRIARVYDQTIVIEQFLACGDIAQRVDEDPTLLLARFAIRLARVIDPACAIAAVLGVDHVAVLEAEIERVVRVRRVVGMALERLFPGNMFTLVLDHALAFGDGPDGVNAPAVHARLAHF